MFHRNSEGVVLTNNQTFQVPKNRSVLSLLDNNPSDGEVFSEDGWVYVNGKKIRKWFENVDGFKFWGPKFEENYLSVLEEKYHKIKTFYEKRWKKIQNKMNFELGCYCGVNDNKEVVLIVKEHDGIVLTSLQHNSLKYPNVVHNQKIIDEYFKYDKITSTNRKRCYMFMVAFKRAINKIFYKKSGSNHLPLLINERFYLFAKRRNYGWTLEHSDLIEWNKSN